jgi:hypothetical protein
MHKQKSPRRGGGILKVPVKEETLEDCAASNAVDVSAVDAEVGQFAAVHLLQFVDGLTILAPVCERAADVHDRVPLVRFGSGVFRVPLMSEIYVAPPHSGRGATAYPSCAERKAGEKDQQCQEDRQKITLTGGGDPVSVILVDWIAGRRSASQSISEERWEEERASSEFFSMGGSERECFRRHLMIGI